MNKQLILIYYGVKTKKVTIRYFNSMGGETLNIKCERIEYCLHNHLDHYLDNEFVNKLISVINGDIDIYEFKNENNNVLKIRNRKDHKKILISVNTKYISKDNYRYSIYSKILRM